MLCMLKPNATTNSEKTKACVWTANTCTAEHNIYLDSQATGLSHAFIPVLADVQINKQTCIK